MNKLQCILIGLSISTQVWANDATRLTLPVTEEKNGVNNLILTAREEKEGAMVETYHSIYGLVNGKVESTQTAACYSFKNEACAQRVPNGNYLIRSTYDLLQQETPVEVKANTVSKPLILLGKRATVEITATESNNGKVVEAYHNILKINGTTAANHSMGYKLPNILVTSCYSYKTESCKRHIPVGHYLVRSHYKNFSKESSLVIKAGDTNQHTIEFRQTGSIEIAATESDEKNWIEAYHSLHRLTEGEANNNRIAACYSHREESCIKKVPVGKYFIRSNYNHITQDTPFEIKPGLSTLLISFKK